MPDSFLEEPQHGAPEENLEPKGFTRSPALTVLIVFGMGILIDAFYPLPLLDWISFSCLAAVLWGIAYYQRRHLVSTCLLLILLFCLGGLRHHVFWSSQPPDHISRILERQVREDDAEKLIRVTGVVSSAPQTKIPDEAEQFNPDEPQQRTSLLLSCRELDTGKNSIPVSGNILLTVYEPAAPNQPAPCSLGDTIDVCGKLKPIASKQNPRDFDFNLYYRKRLIVARLSVKSSEAIHVTMKAAPWSWWTIRQSVQNRIRTTILGQTSGPAQGVALALLLGDRSEMDPKVRQDFSHSGLIHFLAISGLHIGFFSLFVWSLCHVVNLPRKVTVGLLVLAIGFYLSIIEVRPPILRAASFCILVALGLISWRTITTVNLVCVSALLILLINPTDLFDPGTQLSFLAVAAILWTVQQEFYRQPFQQSWIPLYWRIRAEDPALQSSFERTLIRSFRMFYSVFLVTLFIWILTAPLVMYHFNLLTPIGLLLNTLIFPFLFLVLLLGYLLIIPGTLLPWTSHLFGYAFNASLQFLLRIVEFTARIPGGHYDVPSPSLWWLVGYYLFVLLAVLPVRLRNAIFSPVWLRKMRLSLVPCWVMGGLLIPIVATEEPALQCTFIAVDHGAAILIETPSGRSILYDAGSMAPVDQTYDKIRKTLLAHGIRRVDLMLISHADRDHYNAASRLIENQYVRALAFPKAFLDQQQSGAMEVGELAENSQIPVELINQGDSLVLDSETSFEVLHPGVNDVFLNDNPASLTVLVSYRGHKILLTGDLEGDGLQNVLSRESPGKIDILLSPHHGSKTANTRALADWARPDYLIVSGGKKSTVANLKQIYPKPTRIFSTTTDGAITCRISQGGTVRVVPFRNTPRMREQ